MLSIYAYIHGGITISASPFNDYWDSGLFGKVFVDRDTIEKEYGSVTEETIKKAEKLAMSEIKEIDQWLTGDVYGFIIVDDKGDDIESCWGFYGSEYAEQEAKDTIDCLLKYKYPLFENVEDFVCV